MLIGGSQGRDLLDEAQTQASIALFRVEQRVEVGEHIGAYKRRTHRPPPQVNADGEGERSLPRQRDEVDDVVVDQRTHVGNASRYVVDGEYTFGQDAKTLLEHEFEIRAPRGGRKKPRHAHPSERELDFGGRGGQWAIVPDAGQHRA